MTGAASATAIRLASQPGATAPPSAPGGRIGPLGADHPTVRQVHSGTAYVAAPGCRRSRRAPAARSAEPVGAKKWVAVAELRVLEEAIARHDRRITLRLPLNTTATARVPKLTAIEVSSRSAGGRHGGRSPDLMSQTVASGAPARDGQLGATSTTPGDSWSPSLACLTRGAARLPGSPRAGSNSRAPCVAAQSAPP
jgi:hypothetical protein